VPSLPNYKTWIPGKTVSETSLSLPQLSDEVLLKCVQESHKDAFSLLFRRYARTVLGIGRRILRYSAEAEDLVQDVFLYVHRKCALYDPLKGSARSWIVQVAYTQAFLRRRELKSNGFYLSGNRDKVLESQASADTGAHYDRSLEGLFGRHGWKKIVESLTEDQRETFRLHFFEGYTFAEIARKLGQSYVNIRHHYYRGVEKLRKQVHEGGGKRR